MVGAELTHVPYRGSGPAFTDLLAGTVDMMVDTMASVIPAIRSGQVRGLAVTTKTRSAALPEMPTAPRPGCRATRPITGTASSPSGDAGAGPRPAGSGGMAAVKAQAARLEAAGVEPRPEGSAALGAFWDQQLALWIPIIRASGATAD